MLASMCRGFSPLQRFLLRQHPAFQRRPLTVPSFTYDAKNLAIHGVFPGVGFPELDKAGNPTPQYITKFNEACRFMFYGPKMTLGETGWNETEDIQALFKQRMFFVVSQTCEFYPAIYDRSILFKPIEFTDNVINVGKSSVQHLNIGKSSDSGKELYKLVMSAVLVDPETRRPAAHPKWFRDLAKNTLTMETEVVKKMEVPVENVSSYSYIIQDSDTDFYHHVNQSKYFQICHNAASHLARNGLFPQLDTNLARMKLASFQGLYLGESLPGTEISVRVWQDTANPLRLNFDIVNAEKMTNSFQCSFEFMPEPTPDILTVI